jgi:hypothetical protein
VTWRALRTLENLVLPLPEVVRNRSWKSRRYGERSRISYDLVSRKTFRQMMSFRCPGHKTIAKIPRPTDLLAVIFEPALRVRLHASEICELHS